MTIGPEVFCVRVCFSFLLGIFLAGCGEVESEFPSREPIPTRSAKQAQKAAEEAAATVPNQFTVTWDSLESAEIELLRLGESLERVLKYSATPSEAAHRESSARLIRADILAVTRALEDIASGGVVSHYVLISGEYKALIDGIPDIARSVHELESMYYNPYRRQRYYPN
jgi:hypothetical protein